MIKRFFILTLLVLSFAILLSGCNLAATGSSSVTMSGTWDLISPFQRLVAPAYSSAGTAELQTIYSPSAIQQVRDGESDIAIVGSDPTPAEIKGLKVTVVAYDAVCMIIDANSYTGGISQQNGNPDHKFVGFQNVSTEELKDILTNTITPFGQRWFLEDGYYSWGPTFDATTGLYSDTSSWVQAAKALYPSLNMIPGKYDTQTLLYQDLGLNQSAIAKTWNQFTDPSLDAEEEMLSVEYPNSAPFTSGSGDFAFKIGFVSRRVIPVALQHCPIDVVSIDGINPMTDSQAVYDGTYLLSRKIEIITRQNCSPATQQFVNYLLSTAGQQTLSNAGYLPLP
jgi:ABC-type phosphate transport system substrate-binding protein